MAILLLHDIVRMEMEIASGYLVKCSIEMGIKKGVKFWLITIHKTSKHTHKSEFYQMNVLFVFDIVHNKMDLDMEFLAKFLIRIWAGEETNLKLIHTRKIINITPK